MELSDEFRKLNSSYHRLDLSKIVAFRVGGEDTLFVGGYSTTSQIDLAESVACFRKFQVVCHANIPDEPRKLTINGKTLSVATKEQAFQELMKNKFRNLSIPDDIDDLRRWIGDPIFQNEVPKWFCELVRDASPEQGLRFFDSEADAIEIVFEAENKYVYCYILV